MRRIDNELDYFNGSGAVFGASETLYACNTYQFADYSRYDMTLFTEEEKRAHRDAHFGTDLANARALGRRLVEKAKLS